MVASHRRIYRTVPPLSDFRSLRQVFSRSSYSSKSGSGLQKATIEGRLAETRLQAAILMQTLERRSLDDML